MGSTDPRVGDLAAILASDGFLAPEHDARELVEAALGDERRLASLVARRRHGEPLAWIVGSTTFCGLTIHMNDGVYVPRLQSEALASRAAALLPERGIGIDVCTGSGAVAVVMARHRPEAVVIGTDLSQAAIACARGNGIDARLGDLFDGCPRELHGRVDVVTGVVPYVPEPELRFLQRDTFAFESHLSYAGGPDGTDVLRRAANDATGWLRSGGTVLLELGGTQGDVMTETLAALGFHDIDVVADEEGEARFVEARRR